MGLSCIVSKESFIKGDVCNPSNVVTFNGNELIAEIETINLDA